MYLTRFVEYENALPNEGIRTPSVVLRLNIPSKSLGRCDVLRLQADAPVKNTGIIKGYQNARANMELHSYQAFALAR